MSLCSSCGQPCEGDSLFCQDCKAKFDNAFFSTIAKTPAMEKETSPEGEASPFATLPLTGNEQLPVDEAVARLNAAARSIQEEENGGKRLRRSSRLSPLRDISAEIHRASTPHPRTLRRSAFDTVPEREAEQIEQPEPALSLSGRLAKIWPWLHAESDEEKEGDLWANMTDPLQARMRPTSAEAAEIEEADIRRAEMEEHTTLPYPSISQQFRPRSFPRLSNRLSPWHMAFGALVVLAVLALVVDGLLLSFAFNRPKSSATTNAGPPTLTLSMTIAQAGDLIFVQLTHFSPAARLVLTHDVQEMLETTTNASSLLANPGGSVRASFIVSHSWSPGPHLIVAEDVMTRSTASALLQVSGEGPSRPPHLLLDSSSLDMGNAAQGSSTIQPLDLRNTGSGSITWSANSDEPWLLVAPEQGTFSSGQTISVAVQRSALKPGDYTGTITLSSNVGTPQELKVKMKVTPLPPDAGAVISLTPPLLSFSATDGSVAPQSQTLTLSNPGQQALHWSLHSGDTLPMQRSTLQPDASQTFTATQGKQVKASSWLSVSPDNGILPSGQSVQITITTRSQSLLPGAYLSMLTFNTQQGNGAFNTPQVAGISLVVQQHCGLISSVGSISFTAVAGQSNPSPHVVSLNATSSCASSVLPWKALSSNSWLMVNPASGQVKGTNSSFTSIGVNTASLAPGRYNGLVTFMVGKDTQTIPVSLLLQPRPAPGAPIMGALPLGLNFSSIQGQGNSTGQVVTITNNGGSPLKWHTSLVMMSVGWLSATPTGGTVAAGETGQVTINALTKNLTPGTYTGSITLLGTDTKGAPASGSPQTVQVNLTILPPCTLAQPSASSLAFSAIAGGSNPAGQTVTFVASGSCAWPLRWSTSVSPAASWLALAATSGTLDSPSQGGSISLGVSTSIAGLTPGTYTTSVRLNASDSAGTTAQNTPQSFTVSLTVLQPCTLSPLPSTLNFSASQGQATVTAQALNLSETGSCGGGVSWMATRDSNSGSWLGLSATSGTNTQGGSTIQVTPNVSSLTPGTYTGQITISASNNGMVLQGSPQTIKVNLTVTGFTVSGTVTACSGPQPACDTSQGLANAVVTLSNVSGTVATATADASGNFTFSNIPLGSYTLSASGASGTLTYSGSSSVTVSGNTGITIQTFSS